MREILTKLRLLFLLLLVVTLLSLLGSCTTLTTELQTKDIINRKILKRGESCVNNLFGGFTLPYFKDTTIKLGGSNSLMEAINNGDINKVVIIDRAKKHWVFFSKQCTVVYGE